MQIFLVIGPDILMNMLEAVFVWAAWVLFDFYLKQKQRFLVWDFTENANFTSFHPSGHRASKGL